MYIPSFAVLYNRCVVEISGKDAYNFLQGLITNDIAAVNDKSFIYAFMLTPKGKILYDFFITINSTSQSSEEQVASQSTELNTSFTQSFIHENKFLIDCSKENSEQIIKILNTHKLRSNVKIKPVDHCLVIASFSKADAEQFKLFMDPRSLEMGYRGLVTYEQVMDIISINNMNNDYNLINYYHTYNLKRLKLKLVDPSLDIEPGIFFPFEIGLDKFNAINYHKGCYIGQEVIARAKHTYVIRKKIYTIKLYENILAFNNQLMSSELKESELELELKLLDKYSTIRVDQEKGHNLSNFGIKRGIWNIEKQDIDTINANIVTINSNKNNININTDNTNTDNTVTDTATNTKYKLGNIFSLNFPYGFAILKSEMIPVNPEINPEIKFNMQKKSTFDSNNHESMITYESMITHIDGVMYYVAIIA